MRGSRVWLLMLVGVLSACGNSSEITGNAGSEAPSANGAVVLQDGGEVLRLLAPQGRVEIRRAPFGLDFSDARGRSVLRSAAAPSANLAIRPLNP